jgi:hypothetical protein
VKRREFNQAAAILPVAASVPALGEEDWKSRMQRAIEAHMARSEVVSRVLGYGDDVSNPSILFTENVRVRVLGSAGLGAEVPRFHMSVFVVFALDREMETVDDVVASYQNRLGFMEAALLRRAAENNLQGSIAAACTPGEFYGADHGEVPNFPGFVQPPGAELVPPGHRAIMYTNQWQMVFR